MSAPTLPGEFGETARSGPYLGPKTGDQLDALEVLRESAARQAAVTAVLPPYTGPVTGDHLGELGTLERAALERAAEGIGTVPGPRIAARRARREQGFRLPGWWPLGAVLAVQAALSLRLVWSNTAFPDEALYLWAGHQEWSHWLHGTPLPAFPTYFSGSPVVYPPVGALADMLGGLAGARVLSLGFMLGATCALHGVTRRLFDGRAALFSAGVFGALAATQYLGAFATYDAMALMLLAAATWLGVRAASASPRASALLLGTASAVLVLACAAKYAAALFAPAVIAVVVLAATWRDGRRAGVRAALIMAPAFVSLLAVAVLIGGRPYWQGIATTTLERASGGSSPKFLLFVSLKWEGALAALAIFGAFALISSGRRSRPLVALALLLAAVPFLVPLEQARIETYTSLFKHIGYGAWFGSVLAGYCLAAFPRAVARRKAAKGLRLSVLLAILICVPEIPWAASHYGWPDTTAVMPAAQRALDGTGGPVLADDRGNVLDYYLPAAVGGRAVDGTFFFAFNDPVSGRHVTQAAAFAAAVRDHYFGVIFLEFWDSAPQDAAIRADIVRYGGYRLLASVPYRATGPHGDAMIWVRKGARK